MFLLLRTLMKHQAPIAAGDWAVQSLWLGLSLMGSIFPDIDVNSNMQQTFYKSMIIALPLAFLINRRLCWGLAAICGLLKLLKHRGITHNPWFLFLAPGALAVLIAYRYPGQQAPVVTGCIFFATGALSHVFLDRAKTYFLYKNS